MDKLNDLRTDLQENIDLSSKKKIEIGKLMKKSTNDLSKTNKSDIKLKKDNNIKISKNKTEKFDTFFQKDKEKDVDIVNPPKNLAFFISKIKIFFKKHFLKAQIENGKYFKGFLFIVLILFLLLGAKITIEKSLTSGYEDILALKNDFQNLDKATSNIKKARFKFFSANLLISPLSIIPNQNIKNVANLVSGGNDLSKLLLKTLELYDKTTIFLNKNGGLAEIYFTDLLEEIRGNYEEIYSLLYKSLTKFSKITDLGDENLNSKLKFVNEKLKYALVNLEVINNNYDTMLSILGENSSKTYLIVFQNNDEIRPTGGFMGSTATVVLKNGKIEKLDTSDIYSFEWEINKVYTDKEKAPEGLNKVTNTFGIRDSNYFPEFKDSSAKIKSFLDMINYKIDGIIYINQNIILDLLDKIDGVDSKILEQKITKDNFSLIVSTLVEAKVFKVGTLGTPKQVLFDFAKELYEKLSKEKKYYDYMNILLRHIESRDIVFYSFNNEENSLLWKLGLNGEVNFNEKLDFNYPIYTSIGGNKTDRYVQHRYDKTVNFIPGTCDFETKLEIYLAHLFSKYEEQTVNALLDEYGVVDKRDILNIQGRGDNKSFVRILLPKNAIVSPQNNQKVIEYDKYKIVEFYVTTQNLETSRNTISYTIPNPTCEKYSYKFFKQAGIGEYNINFDVNSEKDKYAEIKTDFIYKRDEGEIKNLGQY